MIATTLPELGGSHKKPAPELRAGAGFWGGRLPELAPYVQLDSKWYFPGMGDDPDLIASITPDVMRCLDDAGFFEKLDDALCPKDASHSAESCAGNYGLSESILRASGFEESDFEDIFCVLRARGGFCDCEILYNASESNRLKGKYWRARAEGIELHPHK